MGIRYYAYAFPPELTEQALADPRATLDSDPSGDCWGMATSPLVDPATGIERRNEQTSLDLDKAWWELQGFTRPGLLGETPRPAFAMFTGDVTWTNEGYIPWCGAVAPDAVPAITEDLAALQRETAGDLTDEYVLEYLQRAIDVTAHLATVGHGFIYTIG